MRIFNGKFAKIGRNRLKMKEKVGPIIGWKLP
jgi:hypothetical protein